MQSSSRLDRLPPYLFAELERKISEKKAAGVDVISLGIGDPDTPTPELVTEALAAAAHDPGTHQYPSNRGRPELRQAFARFYARRFGVELVLVGEQLFGYAQVLAVDQLIDDAPLDSFVLRGSHRTSSSLEASRLVPYYRAPKTGASLGWSGSW
jgi:hypothetical protein